MRQLRPARRRGETRKQHMAVGGNGRERASALWAGHSKSRAERLRRAAPRLLALVALLAVGAPFVASAGTAPNSHGPKSYVSPDLVRAANRAPDVRVPVIVQSSGGADAAADAVGGLATPQKKLPLADAVTARVSAADLAALEETSGLTVTRDAP